MIKRIRLALNLFVLVVITAGIIWFAMLILSLSTGRPSESLVDSGGTIIARLMVPAFVIGYARFVENLMRDATTEPRGPGKANKVRWIISTFWRYWKAGASNRVVQGGYLIGGGGFILLALASSLLIGTSAIVPFVAGPVALLFCLASLTQPSAGKWILKPKLSDQTQGGG